MGNPTAAEDDILLVEDNDGDANLVERAFDRRSLPGDLHVVQTGEAAIDWLFRRNDFADAPRPDLVILDLNLPGTNGHAVLEEVRSDPALAEIPMVVLTGSRSEADVATAYENGANAYLVKPVDPEDFGDLVELSVGFWTSAEKPPVDSDAGDDE